MKIKIRGIETFFVFWLIVIAIAKLEAVNVRLMELEAQNARIEEILLHIYK